MFMPRMLPATARVLLCVILGMAAGIQAQTPAGRSLEDRVREIERSPATIEAAFKAGRKVASFCANCHGEAGNSASPDIPNLAGQNTVYLLEQIRQFGDGRRKNEFMQGLIRAMTDEEKVSVAFYFAAQSVTPRPAPDAALVARGKAYYDKICFRCHGSQGHGGEKFARIAGQQTGYLTTTLKRYRDGSATRADPVMSANTRGMSDADLAAVVAYVSSMK